MTFHEYEKLAVSVGGFSRKSARQIIIIYAYGRKILHWCKMIHAACVKRFISVNLYPLLTETDVRANFISLTQCLSDKRNVAIIVVIDMIGKLKLK